MSSPSDNADPSADPRDDESGARVIALLNQKGGVGKTTSTVNLGAAIARAGRSVCLIDLDPQGHLTYHLGLEHDGATVYDLLVDPECTIDDVLIEGARPNLDVILAEVDLAGAETELATAPNRQGILRDKLGPALDKYDVVLIDCPPSLGLLTMNALTLASELFVPMQAHFLALQGVGRLLETVGLVCQSVNPQLRVTGIILCMHEAQTTLAKEIVADLDAFFDAAGEQDVPWNRCRVLRPMIRRNIKLAEAPSFGSTIFDYAPWCPGAIDYRKLAEALLNAWGIAPKKKAGRRRRAATKTPEVAAEKTTDRAVEPKPENTEEADPDSPEAVIRQIEAEVEAEARSEIEPEIVVPKRDESVVQTGADNPSDRG